MAKKKKVMFLDAQSTFLILAVILLGMVMVGYGFGYNAKVEFNEEQSYREGVEKMRGHMSPQLRIATASAKYHEGMADFLPFAVVVLAIGIAAGFAFHGFKIIGR